MTNPEVCSLSAQDLEALLTREDGSGVDLAAELEVCIDIICLNVGIILGVLIT